MLSFHSCKPMGIVITTAHYTQTSSWMENCTKFSQLILSKIIEIDPTSCQILRLKCTKFNFGWGSAPDPIGGAHGVPPDPLVEFKTPTSKGRRGRGEGRRKGWQGRDSEWEGPVGRGEGRGEERGERWRGQIGDEREGRVASS